MICVAGRGDVGVQPTATDNRVSESSERQEEER